MRNLALVDLRLLALAQWPDRNTPPSRDRCSNTPVALCFLWHRRLSLLHPHFFHRKKAYPNPKTGLTRGLSQTRLASEAHRAIGAVARNSIANRAIVGHLVCKGRSLEIVGIFIFLMKEDAMVECLPKGPRHTKNSMCSEFTICSEFTMRSDSLLKILVAHDCGYPLSRYTRRATRVATDFLDFKAFCRCSTGVALHPKKFWCRTLPPPVPGGVAPKTWVWKGVALHGGVAATIAGVALHCATKLKIQ